MGAIFLFVVALLSAAMGASGCSTEEGEGASGSNGLIERCSGTYTCEDGNDPFETTLHREGDLCLAGGLVLFSDGSLVERDDPDVGPGLSWSGDRSGFAICNGDGECVTCAAPERD